MHGVCLVAGGMWLRQDGSGESGGVADLQLSRAGPTEPTQVPKETQYASV
jgi:hypothetical protein